MMIVILAFIAGMAFEHFLFHKIEGKAVEILGRIKALFV